MIHTLSPLSSSLVLKYFFSFQVILFAIYKTVSDVKYSNTVLLRFFYIKRTSSTVFNENLCWSRSVGKYSFILGKLLSKTVEV